LTIALYPGSFDPVTNGHIDVAVRASGLFDELVMGVFDLPPKNIMFTAEERVAMLRKALASVPNVRFELYSKLTVHFAEKIGANVIIRGLRMGSDFEREFDMALMNKKMAPCIETLCVMASADHQFISSSLLKEAAEGGGNIEEFVPKHVADALRKKFSLPKI